MTASLGLWVGVVRLDVMGFLLSLSFLCLYNSRFEQSEIWMRFEEMTLSFWSLCLPERWGDWTSLLWQVFAPNIAAVAIKNAAL